MYGPVFSYRKNPKAVLFGHFLAGAVRGGPEYLGISQSEWRIGVLAGGGVDVRLNERVSFRLIQADYLGLIHLATSCPALRFPRAQSGTLKQFGILSAGSSPVNSGANVVGTVLVPR